MMFTQIYDRSGPSFTRLRCSECDAAIGDLSEQDAGCTSDDAVCERCQHSRYELEEELELPEC